MAIVFRQATYLIPGTYQWVKPPIAAGAGPFGSTYFETIVTVIGASSGGASGSCGNNVANGFNGGNGGNAGAFAQATYLPAVLNALEDIIVGAGTLGGVVTGILGTNNGGGNGSQNSLSATVASKFGAHISCNSGSSSSNIPSQASASVVGGSNVLNIPGGSGIQSAGPVSAQLSVGPNTLVGILHNIPTWNVQGNNGGAPGGSSNNSTAPFSGGDGGGVILGGGKGNTNANGSNAGVPGAGGGGATAAVLGIVLKGGNGANAKPNSGAAGGGGGSATSTLLAGAGAVITGGAGGNGSNGAVQVTDIFTLTITNLDPFYIQLDLIAWYHMMNMARPISLTGRYQS